MNGNLVLVAGPPGCGKTSYLVKMFQDGWLVFDDFKALAFEDCSQFRSSRKLRALLAALQDGLNCMAADIDFCDTNSRRDAETVLREEMPHLEPTWQFFANDRASCEANIRSRNRTCLQRELASVARYSPSYDIPPNAVVLPVWRSKTDN